MKRFTYALSILILLLDSCIDPFNVQLAESETAIVVDGEISDQPGPYSVKLFKTASIQDQYEKIQWISNASVWIIDDLGNEEQLTETEPGRYLTSASGMTGVVDRSYFVRIHTEEGGRYESIPEKMLPVGEIKNLYYEFEVNENPENTNYINTTNGFRVYLDSEVLPAQNGLVRWRWQSTFEMLTYPQFKTKPEFQGRTIVIVPNPPPCSGYIRRGNSASQIGECTCCVCWIDQFNVAPILPEDGLIEDGLLTKNKIAFIPASRRYFHKKYYIEVQQLSTSQIAYDFWRKVDIQKKSGSDLFQTPPPATIGNIRTLSQNTIKARGIFSATSIKKKNLFINRDEIPYYLPRIDTTRESCLNVYKLKDANSSTTKPAYW